MASIENEIIVIIFLLFQLPSRVFSTENGFSWNHLSISCPRGY